VIHGVAYLFPEGSSETLPVLHVVLEKKTLGSDALKFVKSVAVL